MQVCLDDRLANDPLFGRAVSFPLVTDQCFCLPLMRNPWSYKLNWPVSAPSPLKGVYKIFHPPAQPQHPPRRDKLGALRKCAIGTFPKKYSREFPKDKSQTWKTMFKQIFLLITTLLSVLLTDRLRLWRNLKENNYFLNSFCRYAKPIWNFSISAVADG